jgi:hypothetical protein
MGRLLRIKDNKPEVINSKSIEREAELQEFVMLFPEIIPLDEIDEEFKPLLVIGREFTIMGAGSIDLLGIDQAGLITIIEFKLEKNTDIRKVVAQTIEYAANLWELPYDDLDRNVRGYFNSTRCPISELKNKSLAQAVEWHSKKQKTEDDEEFQIEEFIKTVSHNLQQGEFRLIIFCDRVDERTKRTVEYLNEMSKFDIYCASADFYESDETHFIKPYLITKDRERTVTGKQHAGKITIEEYIKSIPAEFEEYGKAISDFNARILQSNGYFAMGTKGFAAYFNTIDSRIKLFEGFSKGIYLLSKNYVIAKGWEVRDEVLSDYENRINQIPVFKDSFRNLKHWRRYTFDRMKPEDLRGYFATLLDWYAMWFKES